MRDALRGSQLRPELRVGVIRSRFNPEITERLLSGALEGLRAAEIPDEQVVVVEVPGAIEIPLVAQALAKRGDIDAIVALGTVIRGETSHYDYVCRAATDGCLRVSLDHQIPVAFGVLTVENKDQALARSVPGDKNKGYQAASCAVEMASLLTRIDV